MVKRAAAKALRRNAIITAANAFMGRESFYFGVGAWALMEVVWVSATLVKNLMSCWDDSSKSMSSIVGQRGVLGLSFRVLDIKSVNIYWIPSKMKLTTVD